MIRKKALAALSAATILTITTTPLPARALNLSDLLSGVREFVNEDARNAINVFSDNINGFLSGDIGNIVEALADIFPSLSTFTSGIQTIIGQLSELSLPIQIGVDELGTGPFGIPDLVMLDQLLTERAPEEVFTIDDIILTGGIAGSNRFSDTTELLRAQAFGLYAKGVGKAIIDEPGQVAAKETVMQVVENYGEIARSTEIINRLDSSIQSATTSFDRLGFQSEQRREAALQTQMAAMNDATLIAGMMESQALAAKQLVLDSERLRIENARNAEDMRSAAAADMISRSSSLYLTIPGGQPGSPDEQEAQSSVLRFIRARQ